MSNNNVEQIMELTVENLALRQLEALQKHALSVVKDLEVAIKTCDISKVKTFDSPAGDCMGEDNVCINFGYKENFIMDIDDLFWKLGQLKKVIEGGQQ